MVKILRMDKSGSQDLAIKALQFIASDPDQLGEFLSITGLGPSNLRQAAQDPSFLNAVLTFIVDDEPRLLSCATALNVKPEQFCQAYEVMVGRTDEGF